MENLSTLQTLAARIGTDAVAAGQPDPAYVAYLVEGNDIGGIDVGLLVKTAPLARGVPRVDVVSVVQEGLTTTCTNPNTGGQEILNDRPPLVGEFVVHYADGQALPLTVIVNHLRSLSDVADETPQGSGTVGGRVRAKRAAQAEFLASLVQTRLTRDQPSACCWWATSTRSSSATGSSTSSARSREHRPRPTASCWPAPISSTRT